MRLLTALGVGAFVAYAVLYDWFQWGNLRHSGDFFALWSYGQVLHSDGAAALYDPARLHTLQTALGMDGKDFNPFPYPPAFLLLVWPLGLAPFGVAFVVWTAVTLGLFLWASTGPAFRLAPLALVLPVTTLGIISGQSGFLAGALMLGGFRLLHRPWLAGLLLGLLTFKPQLGVLVPVALLTLGAWRVIGVAILTALALALGAVALFGDVWTEWLTALPQYAQFFAAKSTRYELMPTVTAGLTMLGVPGVAVWQGLAAAIMAALVWRAYRDGPSAPALLVLTSATFLATPHAFVYDTPMVAGAALLWAAGLPAVGWREFAVLALVLALPPLMVWSPNMPLALSMWLVPFVLVWRCLPARSSRTGIN